MALGFCKEMTRNRVYIVKSFAQITAYSYLLWGVIIKVNRVAALPSYIYFKDNKQ